MTTGMNTDVYELYVRKYPAMSGEDVQFSILQWLQLIYICFL